MEARSQKPEGISAVLALGCCFELDTEILASCFRLLASVENKALFARRISGYSAREKHPNAALSADGYPARDGKRTKSRQRV
ncbi:MAG: hypothetical protein ABSH28_11365 [Acidobacteriota bacterium]|jgi:hypothetical protein